MEPLFGKSVPHIPEKIFFSLHYDSFMECHKMSNEWNRLLSSDRYQRETERMLAEKKKNQERFCTSVRDGNVEDVRRLLSTEVDTNCDASHKDGLIQKLHCKWPPGGEV